MKPIVFPKSVEKNRPLQSNNLLSPFRSQLEQKYLKNKREKHTIIHYGKLPNWRKTTGVVKRQPRKKYLLCGKLLQPHYKIFNSHSHPKA